MQLSENLLVTLDSKESILSFLLDKTLAARSVATGDGVLNYLDLLIDRVHDKDGMVDYMMMNSKGVRKYTAALRATGAAGYDDVMEVKMSSGGVMKVQSYRGVPIFRNDFIQSSDLASVTGGDGGAHDIAAFGDQVFVVLSMTELLLMVLLA